MRGSWNARRCECAVPGCEEVFPKLKDGQEHLEEVHGIRTPTTRPVDGLVPLDPPIDRLRVKRGHAKDHAPTQEEYRRLLDTVRDERDDLALRVLGESGMRANEFLHLRDAWIRGGKIHIPHEDPHNGFAAKTPRAARTIPLRGMSRPAWKILVDYIEAHGDIGFKYHALRLRTISAGKRAGLEKRVTPHGLRAYCATKWAYNLGNPFLLMDLMGWNRPEVAIAYVRLSGRGLEDALRSWNGNGHGRGGGRLESFRDRYRRRGRR